MNPKLKEKIYESLSAVLPITGEEASKFGLGVQEEKDILLIAAHNQSKVAIMQSIGEKCGVRSEAKGIVFALPIDDVIGPGR